MVADDDVWRSSNLRIGFDIINRIEGESIL
jgi:hypothetical protein